MNITNIARIALAAALVQGLAGAARAQTRYVAQDGQTPESPFTSWSTAASNIQDAVDVALAGDTVLVNDGVYDQGATFYNGSNRVYLSKAVTVRSVNGPDVTAIKGQYHYGEPGDPDAVVNGSNSVRCVAFSSSGAKLIGFTIRDGATAAVGTTAERSGGGLFAPGSSTGGTVSNRTITLEAGPEPIGMFRIKEGTQLSSTIPAPTRQGMAGRRAISPTHPPSLTLAAFRDRTS